MRIGSWTPGAGVFVIAEIGGNHNGSFEAAETLVREAARTGVDAVKFQRYNASQLIRGDVPTMAHVRGVHKTQRERMQSLQFDDAQWTRLAALSAELRIVFLSSAFDEASADALDPLVPAFKIASGDLTHLPLIRHVAAKGKPVLISTGMAAEEEIAAAAAVVPRDRLLLLYCVSRYPTPIDELDLSTIPWLSERFGVPVGYSDHAVGIAASVAAAALGAEVIERHFTLDKSQPLGDHKLSSDPQEMVELVARVREARAMRGTVRREPRESEKQMRRPMRRGVHVRRALAAGSVLTPADLIVLRPEEGVRPAAIDSVIGCRLSCDIAEEAPLSHDMLDAAEPAKR